MARPPAPFKVYRYCGCWWLEKTFTSSRTRYAFETQREAIDYAYKNWPWWP